VRKDAEVDIVRDIGEGLMRAKIHCSKIFTIPKEKNSQYLKSTKTLSMEKIKESVSEIVVEKIKPHYFAAYKQR
jgi:hypothetical protein